MLSLFLWGVRVEDCSPVGQARRCTRLVRGWDAAVTGEQMTYLPGLSLAGYACETGRWDASACEYVSKLRGS